MEEKKNSPDEEIEDDLDDLLEQQWAKQDQIHHKCKMREKEKRKKY